MAGDLGWAAVRLYKRTAASCFLTSSPLRPRWKSCSSTNRPVASYEVRRGSPFSRTNPCLFFLQERSYFIVSRRTLLVVFVFLKTIVTMAANTETVVHDAGGLGMGGSKKRLKQKGNAHAVRWDILDNEDIKAEEGWEVEMEEY